MKSRCTGELVRTACWSGPIASTTCAGRVEMLGKARTRLRIRDSRKGRLPMRICVCHQRAPAALSLVRNRVGAVRQKSSVIISR